VTLVGDAGYSPGPAVGGGTTIAVVGAYVLAGELHRAGGDPAVALGAYEHKMREFVRLNRKLGTTNVRRLIPATPTHVRLLHEAMRWVPRLPVPVQRLAAASRAGAFESFALEDYEAGPTR
jgi:2-polyprenyl-6-methoxyphenol hydroxylase-like FAD-dependent oxidoreductase